MKFTGHFTGIKLDRKATLALIQKYLKTQLFEVANVWLKAVTGRVPVWSGMSQGSLLILAETIGSSLTIVPVRGVKSRIALGDALGTATLKITEGLVIITISSEVPHYVLQEFRNVGVSKSAPWLSFAAGNQAYLKEIQNIRLPQPTYKPIKL